MRTEGEDTVSRGPCDHFHLPKTSLERLVWGNHTFVHVFLFCEKFVQYFSQHNLTCIKWGPCIHIKWSKWRHRKNVTPLLQASCTCGVTYSYVASSPVEPRPKKGPGSARQGGAVLSRIMHIFTRYSSTVYSFLTQENIKSVGNKWKKVETSTCFELKGNI